MNKSELIPFLESIKGKKILAKSSGYLACQTTIEEFDFYIKYNILMMKDNKTDNYMVLNLDTIKQIQEDNGRTLVTVYVNDEIETEVSVEII